MIVAVWAVYGPQDGRLTVRLAEYSYKDKSEAEKHAKSVPNGWYKMEKIEK